jgi:hypothetical protein
MNHGPGGMNNPMRADGFDVAVPDRPFSCEGPQAQPEQPLVRLSKDQYEYTLRDVIALGAGPDAEPIWRLVEPQLALVPEDIVTGPAGHTHGGFRKLDQAVQQEHVDQSLQIALTIADELTRTPARLERLVGACAASGGDQACLDAFIRRFGARVLRSPLSADDVAFWRSVHDSPGVSRAGVRDVVAVMLTAPQHLYHVEHGNEASSIEDVYELSAHELANRLSYMFWQTMPDEELWARAEDGTLLDDQVYEAQVRRLATDPRAGATIDRFFHEWLWLDELLPLDTRVGTPVFDAFAGADVPSRQLHRAMIDEIYQMGRHLVLEQDAPLAELLRSNQSFATSPELARLYGVPAWTPGQAPIEFPTSQGRAGLITRAAMLASDSANTRPVMKGFKLRQALLCVKPPPPDDNAAGVEIELRSDMTTREVVEMITEQPGTSCEACHQAFMNPLGFATESFDALGRHRTHQRLFDAQGQLVGERAVNTAAISRVRRWDDRELAGAPELTEALDESGLVHACFARHWVRYTFGREEQLGADGCLLKSMHDMLLSGMGMREVLIQAALRPEVKQRRMTGVEGPR